MGFGAASARFGTSATFNANYDEDTDCVPFVVLAVCAVLAAGAAGLGPVPVSLLLSLPCGWWASRARVFALLQSILLLPPALGWRKS